jgi:hypothetical protein
LRLFGFVTDKMASLLHLANHRAEVGLKEIDGFAGAADLDRLASTRAGRLEESPRIRCQTFSKPIQSGCVS